MYRHSPSLSYNLYMEAVRQKDTLVEGAESITQDFGKSYEAIIKFIDQLSFLDDVDKHWARKDAEESLLKDGNFEELQEKYQFYDQVAELQQQVIKNIPASKQEEVLNIIRQVTSKPSSGRDRQMKLEHVLRVKKTVDAFRENQITLQFLVQEKITSGDVHFGVAQILSGEIFKSVEKLFPDRFWKLSDRMFPNDFPHFTVAFNFTLKESFNQEQSTSKIKAFSEKIKTSIIEDGQNLLSEFFGEKAKGTQLESLKKIPADKPAKLLGKILALQSQHEKHESDAQKGIQEMKAFIVSKNPKGAQSVANELKKHFGKNVFSSLRQTGLITKLELTMQNISTLEKQFRLEKNPSARKKLEQELVKLQQPKQMVARSKESSGEKRKKIKTILEDIREQKQQGALSSAERSAQKLRSLDNERAQIEIAKIKAAQAKKKSSKEQSTDTKESSEGSESKQKKIRFLEMLKEHAQKVMEECGQLGIPKDSERFWGINGVRNRMQYLKNEGLWNKYQQFNASDRNMPSKTHEGGFRFRWVNLTTGTNLNTTSAQRGIEYLTQRKESGYAIAALGAAFSVNWKGHSSPVYKPERFISFVEAELSRVKGSN